MPEELDEPFDASIPEALVVPQPVIGALERPGIDAAVVNASADGAFHETGFLERLDVLRGCRERHPMRGSQVADGLLALRQGLEHGPPRPVAESAEDDVESFILFNHVVE